MKNIGPAFGGAGEVKVAVPKAQPPRREEQQQQRDWDTEEKSVNKARNSGSCKMVAPASGAAAVLSEPFVDAVDGGHKAEIIPLFRTKPDTSTQAQQTFAEPTDELLGQIKVQDDQSIFSKGYERHFCFV